MDIFSHLFVVRIIMFVWEDKKTEKRPRMAHFFKKRVQLTMMMGWKRLFVWGKNSIVIVVVVVVIIIVVVLLKHFWKKKILGLWKIGMNKQKISFWISFHFLFAFSFSAFLARNISLIRKLTKKYEHRIAEMYQLHSYVKLVPSNCTLDICILLREWGFMSAGDLGKSR